MVEESGNHLFGDRWWARGGGDHDRDLCGGRCARHDASTSTSGVVSSAAACWSSCHSRWLLNIRIGGGDIGLWIWMSDE